MRHRVAHRKLGRTSEHRKALLRNLTVSLILSDGRIRTTLAKAKELRPFAEKLVTLGKKDTLHARRQALAVIPQKEAVAKLFNDISPRFAERPGGYTRILKLGPRRGDGAPMAFIEFVDYEFKSSKEAKEPVAKKPEKKPKKAEKKKETEAPEEDAAEKPKKKAAKKTAKKVAKKTAKKAAAKKKPAAKKTAAKKATKKVAAAKTTKKTAAKKKAAKKA